MKGKDIQRHLLTGVSYFIPFVVAGGILIALGFLFGGIYVYEGDELFFRQPHLHLHQYYKHLDDISYQ